ncbi:DUF4352 domain-containing protein [Halalkalibacter nanhaiisediminis]|uniref:Uncharacterized protein DUF4352 n=1 Tax=Halalkalibacter nanhaiisediminis TaxID=688079 RepID=A0A562QET5_9BACI|nr:DUF4352 domain-containing protein [Halalkalibacter nanhaiisediminis]TWI55268.1 uncharacterized protein DUF4352 [Halalkalibacter nanhaiisediminis]
MKKVFKFGCLPIVGLFILIAIVGSFMGGDDTTTTTSAPTDETEESINEPTEEEVTETVGIGETLELGEARFTVHGIETGVTEVGNQYLNKSTTGQFVLVDLTFLNEGTEAVMTDTSFFKLLSGDRTFDADGEASMYANDERSSFFLESVNPGMDRRGIVVFETPADASDFILEVQTGFWGSEKAQIVLE